MNDKGFANQKIDHASFNIFNEKRKIKQSYMQLEKCST